MSEWMQGRREEIGSSWRPARRRIAVLAMAVAIATATAGIVWGGAGAPAALSLVYVVLAAVALFYPAAIAAQVVGGQVLVGTILIVGAGPPVGLVVTMLGGVVATAELLAVAARLDIPIESHPGNELPRIALAVIVAAGVFGAVLLASRGAGPGGLAAVGLASAACVALAEMLVRQARTRRG